MAKAAPIRLEPLRAATAPEECAALRRAVDAGSASREDRARLVALLNLLDAFDDTIALLGGIPRDDLTQAEWLGLAVAHAARDKGADRILAIEAARAAFGVAQTDAERSAARTAEAKGLSRLSRPDAARNMLEDALRYDAANGEACQLLVAHLLREGAVAEAFALTERLAGQGVRHARLFAARGATLARLGRHDEARATLGLEQLLRKGSIAIPDGWTDLAAFNAAVAAELLDHAALRYDRHGKASVASWRIDSLSTGATPLARLLLERITDSAQGLIDDLASVDHPWITACPDRPMLRAWCVITDGSGYERWHAHPVGWMSGVYYVQVPDDVQSGSDESGCLTLGRPIAPPDRDQADGAAPGDMTIRPNPGLLMLFPSYTLHRTFPHRSADKRICVAFDIG